jgi:hypothetical protein
MFSSFDAASHLHNTPSSSISTTINSQSSKRTRHVFAKDMVDIVRTTNAVCSPAAVELNPGFLNTLDKCPALRGYLSKCRIIDIGIKIDDADPLPLTPFLQTVTYMCGYHLSRNINMPNIMDKDVRHCCLISLSLFLSHR